MPITFYVIYNKSLPLYVNAFYYIQQLLFLAPAFMWYLMAVVVGIVILYILLKLDIAAKNMVLFGMLLYFIGCIGNSYVFLFGQDEALKFTNIYYDIFLTTRNGLFFGFPFILSGL